jgi:hypothetical protein
MDRQLLGTAEVPLATPEKDPKTLRRYMLAQHNELVAALLAGDADRIAALYTKGCRGALRDYANDTGTITAIEDVEGIRDHYRRFFEAFDVQSVEVMHRVVQDWYLFAELRFEVVARTGPEVGNRLAFHTAGLLIPGKDDKFIVEIGHGSDQAPL